VKYRSPIPTARFLLQASRELWYIGIHNKGKEWIESYWICLMPDVFICYSAKDEKLARWLYKSCENLDISTFLAPISIRPGTKWKQTILDNLREVSWFFFLATPNSIRSDSVKHEIGGALALNHDIIPILYNLEFKDLPESICFLYSLARFIGFE
jgi:hypothetical protein